MVLMNTVLDGSLEQLFKRLREVGGPALAGGEGAHANKPSGRGPRNGENLQGPSAHTYAHTVLPLVHSTAPHEALPVRGPWPTAHQSAKARPRACR